MKKSRREHNLSIVILAAGLGTRMKSSIPKVLHRIYDKPLLQYCLETVSRLNPSRTVVVLGREGEKIRESIGSPPRVSLAMQPKQLGTANALLAATQEIPMSRNGTVLVINGDTPLIAAGTLKKFLRLHLKHKNSISILSFEAPEPFSYGRIIRDAAGKPLRIREEKDASKNEKTIKEVNSGVYAIDHNALPLLNKIKLNRKKGEYYLTDIVEVAAAKETRTGVFCVGREEEFLGVNTRKDLLRAQEIMRRTIIEGWLENGVSFLDTSSVHIDAAVKIGYDTLIYPNVWLQGKTRIGNNCIIYPNVRISGSTIRDGSVIKDCTVIEHSLVGAGAQIGPFAHVRPESRIGESVRVGNFVELKKAVVGRGTKAMHLSYIGDARLGRNVNIGAGTITCNYDGAKKHQTDIGDNVFVGSDTQLVAPVKIGKGAYIGAGSTITRNVPPGTLAKSRVAQTHRKKKKI